MDSPVVFILISMIFTSATLAIIFFLAWKNLGEKRYALTWATGFSIATVQWFLNLNSGWFTNFEVYWLVVNALALTMITLSLRGHCQRTDCGSLPNNLWPYTGAVYFVIVWATIVEPHVGLRTMLVPATGAVTLFLSALIIVRHREKTRPAEWAAAASVVLFGISQGIAAGMAIMQGPAGDETFRALYLNFNFITLPAGYLATSMFVILMVASDISEEMKEVAIRDSLTGLLNRRGLAEHGAVAYASARRANRPISVVVADIDRFKFINDDFGHAVGDNALCHFAELLGHRRREEDILARLGGEEFVVVLPGVDTSTAIEIGEQLRKLIEASPMETEQGGLVMTSSFGVATLNAKDACLTDIIIRADRALYRSKRAGRNQIDLESSQMMLAEDGSLQPVSGT